MRTGRTVLAVRTSVLTCRLFRFRGLGGGRPRGNFVMSSGTPSGTHAMSLFSFNLRDRDPAISDDDDDDDSSSNGLDGTAEPADDDGDREFSKPTPAADSGLYGEPGLLPSEVLLALAAVEALLGAVGFVLAVVTLWSE